MGEVESAFEDMAKAVELKPDLREFPRLDGNFDPKSVLNRFASMDEYFRSLY